MRVDVTASSSAIREAIKSIDWYDAKSRMGLEKAIGSAVRRMAYKARAKVPRDSGSLRNSIYTSMKKQLLQGEFGARKPHAHLIEYGTKSYTVQPVKRKRMRMADSGVIRFTSRKVTIPARPARPFIEPAYKTEEPKFLSDIKKVLQKP